ncbi:MAG TPA: SurA N-terminal domain-containing protein [Xanthobacteraceae bacterium]|nr:SurA N-terminal domain-containing protein [Xanthobacteraceae bacterium]
MLRGIRKASSNWLGRIVMGVVMTVLAASFAIWGINDIFRGFSNSSLAKIGSTEIAIDTFRQTYNDRLQALGQQLGHPITPDQANAMGVDRVVLQEMVAQAGLDQRVQQMRLGISDAEIARLITSDPAFQTNGKFDPARFQDLIRNAGYTEQRYVARQRGVLLRRQLIDSISGGITAPKAWLDAINQYQNEERSIAYMALGPAQAGDIPQPTAEQISKYFNDRKILFRAPEYRKIVVVSLTPADLAKTIEVSDDDVKKAFEQNHGKYITPERRHVEQIVFPNMAEAQAASERIKGGLSFVALAAERGLKAQDIDLGTVPKSQIIDPKVADAAFSLKEGEVSAPIDGRFGPVIVTVLAIEPEVDKTLADVAPQIRNEIALDRAKSQVQDIHDKVEDERAGGSTLEEAAQKLKLPVVTYDAVDRSGRDPTGNLIPNLPRGGDLVSAAYATDVGVDNDPIEADGGYVWYEVSGITPARDRTLDEVKSQVEARWHDDEVATRLKDKAADLLDKLKNGTALDALAASNALKVEAASGLKRGKPTKGISGRMIDTIFHTAKDAYGSAEGDQPSQWIVFRVTDDKTPALDPNAPDIKTLAQTVQRQLSDDIMGQYVAWLEDDLGTTVNTAAMAQALGNGTPDTN